MQHEIERLKWVLQGLQKKQPTTPGLGALIFMLKDIIKTLEDINNRRKL